MNLASQIHDQEIRDLINVLRYEAGLSSRITAHLRGLEKDLLGAYLNAGDITSQRRLHSLLKECQEAIADRYEAAKGLHDKEMGELAGIQAEKAVAILNGAINVDIFNMFLTKEQINAIASDVMIEGAPSAEWWELQEADTLRKFSNAVRGGMLRGATMDEISREIRELMGTSMRNAQVLVRTSVITTNNAAHMSAYKANSDLMAGYQWMATMDPRTCAMCGALDGKKWAWNEPHPVPSLHWGCRCMGLPVTKSWEELAREAHGNSTLAKQLDKMDPGTRASMDGQVAASTTYEDWLKGKSEAEQRSILGGKRFDIMQKGKLSLSDLTNQSGRELTLKQLAAL